MCAECICPLHSEPESLPYTYPAHFYAAVLDHLGLGVGGGMYPTLIYVVEARRHPVRVDGPSVNGTWWSAPAEHTVRCGLRILQAAMNIATLERLHAASRQRPFESVTDLCTRVELTATELERLIAAGALDELALSRRQARWEAQFAHVRRLDQATLLDEESWPQPPIVEAESRWERAAEEYATLGFPLSVAHPLDLYPLEEDAGTIVCAGRLAAHVGQCVTVSGVVVAGRRIRTASGRVMAFASLCDRSGVMELTLFEDVAQRSSDLLHVGSVVRASGIVSQDVERGVGVEVQAVDELRRPNTSQELPGGADVVWADVSDV